MDGGLALARCVDFCTGPRQSHEPRADTFFPLLKNIFFLKKRDITAQKSERLQSAVRAQCLPSFPFFGGRPDRALTPTTREQNRRDARTRILLPLLFFFRPTHIAITPTTIEQKKREKREKKKRKKDQWSALGKHKRIAGIRIPNAIASAAVVPIQPRPQGRTLFHRRRHKVSVVLTRLFLDGHLGQRGA